jgi:hypothetical protein
MWSQQPSAFPFPKPQAFSPRHTILLLQDPFQYYPYQLLQLVHECCSNASMTPAGSDIGEYYQML